MMINERRTEEKDVKELKVKIPVTYHTRLHSLKSDTGRQISHTVTDALHEYFAALRAAKAESN